MHWIAAVGYGLTVDRSCVIPISHATPTHNTPDTASLTNGEAGTTEPKVAYVSSMCVAEHDQHQASQDLTQKMHA